MISQFYPVTLLAHHFFENFQHICQGDRQKMYSNSFASVTDFHGLIVIKGKSFSNIIRKYQLN